MRQVASGKSMEVSPTYRSHGVGANAKKRGEEWRTHFGQENCIHERAMLEMGQNPHALDLTSGTMNVGFSQVFSICLG